jgi:hypothetical protein
MRFNRTLALGLLTIGGAISLSTAAASEEPKDQEAKAVASKDEKICRRLPPPLGSRVGSRRVCKTQAQWDADERIAKELAQDTARRGLVRNVPGEQ